MIIQEVCTKFMLGNHLQKVIDILGTFDILLFSQKAYQRCRCTIYTKKINDLSLYFITNFTRKEGSELQNLKDKRRQHDKILGRGKNQRQHGKPRIYIKKFI